MSIESREKKQAIKGQRKRRITAKVKAAGTRPRLSVFKSLKHIYLQVIDDSIGKVLVAAHDTEADAKSKTDKARELGKILAKKAIDKGIKEVVFDRGGNKFHGRVKAAAEGAREAGLIF